MEEETDAARAVQFLRVRRDRCERDRFSCILTFVMLTIFRRLKPLPMLSLLLLCLLTGPASTLGYVWCLDADGHAVLETAVAGDCGQYPSATTNADPCGLPLTVAAGDCGPCLDVDPSHQLGAPRYRQHDTPESVPAAHPLLAAASVPRSDRLLADRPYPVTAHRPPEPLRHHRTIVLLI